MRPFRVTPTELPSSWDRCLSAAGFSAQSNVLTDRGRRRIASLRNGDRVWTLGSGIQSVKWTMHRRIVFGPKSDDLRPVRIAAGALGDGRPSLDVTVAPGQRLLLNDWRIATFLKIPEVLVLARDLIGQPGITSDTDSGSAQYCYLQFQRFELIETDGLIGETFLNDRRFSLFSSGALHNTRTIAPSRPVLTRPQAEILRRVSVDRSVDRQG